MLSKQMKYFLIFFDVLGFNTGSSKLSQSVKLSNAICVYSFIAIIFTLFAYKMTHSYYTLLGFIEAISEFVQYLVPLCTYWLIIMDSIIQSQSHRQFWKVLHKIDKSFYHQTNHDLRIFLIKFIEFLVVRIIVVVIRLFVNDFTLVNLAYTAIINMCLFRVFYYIFCIEIIQFHLNIIQSKFEPFNINLYRSMLEHRIKKSNNFVNFKLIREYFNCIYEMINLLNEIFSWSHVATISLCFSLILTDLNRFYLRFLSYDLLHRIGIPFTFSSFYHVFIHLIFFSNW